MKQDYSRIVLKKARGLHMVLVTLFMSIVGFSQRFERRRSSSKLRIGIVAGVLILSMLSITWSAPQVAALSYPICQPINVWNEDAPVTDPYWLLVIYIIQYNNDKYDWHNLGGIYDEPKIPAIFSRPGYVRTYYWDGLSTKLIIHPDGTSQVIPCTDCPLPGGYISGTEIGPSFYVFCIDDPDGDGIENEIDTDVCGYSDVFDDKPGDNYYDGKKSLAFDGETEGKVVDRNGNKVIVENVPSAANGVKVTVSGNQWSTLLACPTSTGDGFLIWLSPGLTTRILRCGSLTLGIEIGEAHVSLPGSTFVIIPAGATATISEITPAQYLVTNDPSSTVPITVGEIQILPGDSVVATRPPTIYSFPSRTSKEGAPILLTVLASDPDGDPIVYSFDFESDGTFDVVGQSNQVYHTYLDNGVYQAIVRASDGVAFKEATAQIHVGNENPVVFIDAPAPGFIAPVGTPIEFTGHFTDAGILDTHTPLWNFYSSSNYYSEIGSIIEGGGSGTLTASFAFEEPGVYQIMLQVTDNDGGVGKTWFVDDLWATVVVYDPNGGYVTGGGWFDSPYGAFAWDYYATGKATFGFIAKYNKGANIPSGETEFQFRVAGLSFHSESYQWLICGGFMCKFKGEGILHIGKWGGPWDQEIKVGFMITAIDGDLPGGDGKDRFRIKIWDYYNEWNVIYDNMRWWDEEAEPPEISGGSIVIHKG